MKAWQQLFTFGVRRQRSLNPAMYLGIALALILATLAAAPATAGPPVACPTTQIKPQCIDDLAVTPHGTYADISFFLATAQLATVAVSTVAPNKQADGTWSYSGVPTIFFVVSSMANTHAVHVPDLEPHHTYHYLINAGKAAIGDDAQRTGSFTTLTRHARVAFTSIHVTDDSDDLSPGDLIFWFSANGWLSQVSNGTLLTFPLSDSTGPSEAEISSGGTIPLPANEYSHELVPAPATLTLKVSGQDHDCDFWQACPSGNLPSEAGGGSDSWRDWAVAETAINLAKSGPGEAFTQAITWGTENYSLKFEVAATFKVWYA